MALESQLKAYAEAVDVQLDELLPSASVAPVKLHKAMRYSCLAPGKRLRPALCMACAEAVGASAEAVIDAGCAVEMVHCFSLIHDDLPAIDDDDLRRGQPTCHKQFGEALAILAGDALFALAFEILSHPESTLRAVQLLTRATGSDGLVGGEVVDVLSEGVAIDLDTLRFIHSRKTGALMGAACAIGATLGRGSETQIGEMERFGQILGLAFQITDDILNETSDPARLGKSVGSDRERQKATYTAFYGLNEAKRRAEQTAAEAIALVPHSAFLRELAEFTVRRLH